MDTNNKPLVRLFGPVGKIQEDWNDKSREYDRLVLQALLPIVEKAKSEGVSLRDLHNVINSTVYDLIINHLLDSV